MKPDPSGPSVALCVDVLAPEGYGEIIGGGQRLDDLDLLLQRIEEHDLPQEAFEWYLDLRRYGSRAARRLRHGHRARRRLDLRPRARARDDPVPADALPACTRNGIEGQAAQRLQIKACSAQPGEVGLVTCVSVARAWLDTCT